MKDKTLRAARRDFLRQMAKVTAGLGAGSVFGDHMLAPIFNQALAQSLHATTRDIYYLQISLAGGLPRWQFDLPLQPKLGEAFSNPASSFGTRIEVAPGDNYRPVYTTIEREGYRVPPVWGMNAGGKDYSALLKNALWIRGVDMEINSHSISNRRQNATNIGGYSISGAVADQAGRPIPAVLSGIPPASDGHRSSRGLSGVNFNSALANPLTNLLAPYRDLNARVPATLPNWLKAREQAFAQFDSYAKQIGLTNTTLADSYSNAEELIAKRVIDMASNFDAALKRYKDLIAAAVTHDSYVDDFIPSNVRVLSGNIGYRVDDQTSTTNAMLRDFIAPGRSEPIEFAAGFATTELLFKAQLTSSMILGSNRFNGIQVRPGTVMSISHDHHFVGRFAETYITTLYYRSLIACLSEFRDQLGPQWEKTFVHVAGEWNRNPRDDGSGSDHGVIGSGASLYSGAIQGLAVVGNVRTEAGISRYPGTWGVAGDFRFDDKFGKAAAETEVRPLVLTDVTRTITAMLGVRDLVANGYPLMKLSGKMWVPVKAEAKNV